jgi:hypothetical protein
VGNGGSLAAVGRAELAQDVRDVNARGLDAPTDPATAAALCSALT